MSAAKSKDIHVETALLQKEIQSHIGLESSNVIFDFHDHKNKVQLDLRTVNPVHRQSFLFHTTQGKDRLDAMKKMLQYARTYQEEENSYTIQWSLKSTDRLETSYFRAINIVSAIEKLYHGRDAKSIIIFSVILNPVS